jgi:hypothetical protein
MDWQQRMNAAITKKPRRGNGISREISLVQEENSEKMEKRKNKSN